MHIFMYFLHALRKIRPIFYLSMHHLLLRQLFYKKEYLIYLSFDTVNSMMALASVRGVPGQVNNEH